jgi:hypothetical protein
MIHWPSLKRSRSILSAGAGVGSSQKGILRVIGSGHRHSTPDKDAVPPTCGDHGAGSTIPSAAAAPAMTASTSASTTALARTPRYPGGCRSARSACAAATCAAPSANSALVGQLASSVTRPVSDSPHVGGAGLDGHDAVDSPGIGIGERPSPGICVIIPVPRRVGDRGDAAAAAADRARSPGQMPVSCTVPPLCSRITIGGHQSNPPARAPG